MSDRQALASLSVADRMTYHLLKKGKTQIEVASMMGVTRQAISLRVKHMVERGVALQRYAQTKGPKKAWTTREEARLIKLYNQGVPGSEIAQELGRGVYSVRARLTVLQRQGQGRPQPHRAALDDARRPTAHGAVPEGHLCPSDSRGAQPHPRRGLSPGFCPASGSHCRPPAGQDHRPPAPLVATSPGTR